MAVTCVIINKDVEFAELLKKHIENADMLVHIRTFINGQCALKYLRENMINLVLIDPNTMGVSIRMIELLESKPMIVIASSSKKYALEGFEHNVVDYILQDVTYERFKRMIEKVTNRLT